MAVLLLFFLLGRNAWFGVFFDDVIVVCAFHLGGFSALLVDHSLLLLVLLLFFDWLLVTSVDQAHDFFVL